MQMTTQSELARPLKTWSHLAGRRRRPTEYETVSTNLLWSTADPEAPWTMGQGIAMTKWYKKYRNYSPLKSANWDGFRDPDQLIYRNYTLIQDGQEAFVDGLIEDHSRNEHDVSMPDQWTQLLGRFYTPSRYLMHAVQMSSNYLVALAPASAISNCFMFQAGDHLRWLSRVSYRTAELRIAKPHQEFGAAERAHWEHSPEWQGYRELTEKVLVAWDWAEQFVALNLVLKPAIDAGCIGALGQCARRNGDTLTGLLADAQLIDSERTRRWTIALVKYALDSDPGNADVIRGFLEKWNPLGVAAMVKYCGGLPDGEELLERALETYRANQLASGVAAELL
jgi:toluene monooxygenase system protein E